MSKRRLYFHIFLILVALLIGGLSIYNSGLIPEGKNYPNLTALAMVFLLLGQLAQLKAYQNQKNSKNS